MEERQQYLDTAVGQLLDQRAGSRLASYGDVRGDSARAGDLRGYEQHIAQPPPGLGEVACVEG